MNTTNQDTTTTAVKVAYRSVPAYGYGANLERWNGQRWVFVLTGTGHQCMQAKAALEVAKSERS